MFRAFAILALGVSCAVGVAEARKAEKSWTALVNESLLERPSFEERVLRDRISAEDDEGADANSSPDLGERGDEASDDSSEDDSEAEGRSWSLTVALESGYDSNYDEDEDGIGSAFLSARVGAELERRIGKTDVEVSADIAGLWLPRLSIFQIDDTNADIRLGHRFSQWLVADALLEASLDLDDDPKVLDLSASIGAEYSTSAFELALRPQVETRTVVSGAAFNFEDDERTLDFIKPGISFRSLLRPESRVSPYVEAEIARVKFSGSDARENDDELEQDDNPDADGDEADFDDDDEDEDDSDGDFLRVSARDAWTGRISTGLRFKPTPRVTAWLGVRASHRRFDEGFPWRTLTVISPEFRAEWKIDEDLSLTADYRRAFSETDSIGVLVDDESVAEVALALEPDTGFGGRLSGAYSRTREIGTGTKTKDYEAEAAVTYRLNEDVLFLLGLAHTISRSNEEDDDFNRTVLRFGAEVKF